MPYQFSEPCVPVAVCFSTAMKTIALDNIGLLGLS